MTPAGLTPKQQRFVAEYLVDLNATQAAIRTGYSARTANREGTRLLANPVIAMAVVAGKAAQLAKAEITAVRVLEELGRIAFVDVRTLFDGGPLKSIVGLSAEHGAVIASVEVIQRTGADGMTYTIHKVKCWDKVRALEMLAKYLGLLKERVQHEADDRLLEILEAGRQRVARGE